MLCDSKPAPEIIKPVSNRREPVVVLVILVLWRGCSTLRIRRPCRWTWFASCFGRRGGIRNCGCWGGSFTSCSIWGINSSLFGLRSGSTNSERRATPHDLVYRCAESITGKTSKWWVNPKLAISICKVDMAIWSGIDVQSTRWCIYIDL